MVTFYRRLPRFDYVRPAGIDEALDLLSKGKNGQFRVYAGGTDLIPKIKARALNPPEALIDLKGIPGMDYVENDEKEGLRIGALATLRSVAGSQVVKERFPILSRAAGSIASIQVQNRGTIAGNICNAVPSADSAPALLCLGARLMAVSKKGDRWIGIDEFFTGPNETALGRDEILKEIRIPPLNGSGTYIKLSTRSRMDLAVVGAGVQIAAEKGVVKDIRIGLGAVAPTPMRAKGAEDILRGERATDDAISRAAQEASRESRPIDDHRASAEYRRMMVEVLVRRAINQALSRS